MEQIVSIIIISSHRYEKPIFFKLSFDVTFEDNDGYVM